MFADLHIHSRFSRACSKDITFENLVKWAKIKGLNLLGTGDFTHPIWFEEIKKLRDNGKGFYYFGDFPFIISGEVSLMYSDGGKSRKIHLVVLVPSIEIAEKINSYLDTKGRRDYDGRPIFGIHADVFVRDLLEISKDIEIIPAHVWTPWFGVFGSMSGFDSLEECFKEQEKNIHAIETGISSDPPMNWKIPFLSNKTIVSFSDAHSFWPWRLGREATIFKETDSYVDVISQIRENKIIGTIETEPAYGKYHWDGHRVCNFSCPPKEAEKRNNICPICGGLLTIGVEHRVESLSGESSYKNKKYFYTLLPLHEIISLFLGVSLNSKKVWDIYNTLLDKFKNEFEVLLSVSEKELLDLDIPEKLVRLILINRDGKIKVKPGYDGVYGVALIEGSLERQMTLF